MEIVKGCVVNIDGVEWFPAQNTNLLCQQIGKRIICRDILPYYDQEEFLYNAIHKYAEKIFLVPWRAKDILVYDTKRSGKNFLSCEELSDWQDMDYKYSFSITCDNFLYLFGRRIPGIVKINMCTNKIELLNGLIDSRNTNLNELEPMCGLFFSYNYVREESCVWIPLLGEKGIVQFNLLDDSLRLYDLPIGCSAICQSEERGKFWLFSQKQKSIIKWSCSGKIEDKINNIDLRSECGETVLKNDSGRLKCISNLESINVDLETRQCIKGKGEISKEVIQCAECSDDLLSRYFRAINKEEKCYLENTVRSFRLYMKYIVIDKEQTYFKQSRINESVVQHVGSKIHLFTKAMSE